jgi:hypothetical protein
LVGGALEAELKRVVVNDPNALSTRWSPLAFSKRGGGSGRSRHLLLVNRISSQVNAVNGFGSNELSIHKLFFRNGQRIHPCAVFGFH